MPAAYFSPPYHVNPLFDSYLQSLRSHYRAKKFLGEVLTS